jgi:hypothetical protein
MPRTGERQTRNIGEYFPGARTGISTFAASAGAAIAARFSPSSLADIPNRFRRVVLKAWSI